jgi:hypothetical protein
MDFAPARGMQAEEVGTSFGRVAAVPTHVWEESPGAGKKDLLAHNPLRARSTRNAAASPSDRLPSNIFGLL